MGFVSTVGFSLVATVEQNETIHASAVYRDHCKNLQYFGFLFLPIKDSK